MLKIIESTIYSESDSNKESIIEHQISQIPQLYGEFIEEAGSSEAESSRPKYLQTSLIVASDSSEEQQL